MTAGRFGEVDHDLLADYVGGALEGTPDKAVVARLVAEEPEWARAHDDLIAATEQVSHALAVWGSTTPAMPPAVVERLTAALAGAGPALPSAVPAQGPPVGDTIPGTEPGSRTVAVVGAASRPATGVVRARGRRRWSRRTAPVLVATATLVAAGLGVSQVVRDDSVVGGQVAEGETSTRFRLVTEPTRTGTSYTPATVGEPPGPGVLSTHGGGVVPQPEADPRLSAPPGDLARLTARAALEACLEAVGVAHARGAVTVDRVEYAAFQGSPALIVGLVDAEGDRWVMVAGPECGVPGSGADTRYRAQVG